MRLIKVVNIFEGIASWFEESGSGFGQFTRNTEWLYCEHFEEMQRRLKVKVEVNDIGDICVKMAAKKSSDEHARTIYYFEKGSLVDDANKLPDLEGFRAKDLKRQSTVIVGKHG